MWLEDRKDSTKIRSFGGRQGCSNFGRMMCVVIDDSNTDSRFDLESPVDPPKAFKRISNDAGFDAHITGRRKSGCRIQDVVHTRNIEAKLFERSAVKSQGKRGAETFDIHIRDPHIGRSSG